MPVSSAPSPAQPSLRACSFLNLFSSYKAQVSAIVRQYADPSVAASSRRNWDRAPGSGGQTAGGVVVSTCDAFQVGKLRRTPGCCLSCAHLCFWQGAECEIVILSLCRTQGLGAFVESAFRVNVALTRARRHLWVCGHGQMLQRSTVWKE